MFSNKTFPLFGLKGLTASLVGEVLTGVVTGLEEGLHLDLVIIVFGLDIDNIDIESTISNCIVFHLGINSLNSLLQVVCPCISS